jgi:hypothetical protein
LFEAGLDEFIQIAVEHFLRIGYFHVGVQILDARIVEPMAANRVAQPTLDLLPLSPALGLICFPRAQA